MQMPADIFKTVNVKRYAGGTRVSGRWVEGAESATTITAYIEPIGEQAARNKFITLDAGRRWEGGILIITDEELTMLRAGGNDQSADRVTWNGRDYEVMAKDNFEFVTLEEAHHEYLAVQVTQ